MHPLSRVTSPNVVLLFHVLPSQSWFRATLKTVSKKFHFVSLADVDAYFHDDRAFTGACHVCFDDGDRTLFDMALPVLEELDIPASVHVSPRIIREQGNYWFQDLDGLMRQGAEPQIRAAAARALGCAPDRIEGISLFSLFKCMSTREIGEVLATVRSETELEVTQKYNVTPNELLALRDSGLVTIGAHTQGHPILALESDESSKAQILDSVHDLSDLLGQPVFSFAYPNGIFGLDFSNREKLTLTECGIRLAFSTRTGFFHRSTDPFEIPRVGLEGTDRERGAWITGKLLLTPVWDPIRDLLKRETEAKERARIQSLITREQVPVVHGGGVE